MKKSTRPLSVMRPQVRGTHRSYERPDLFPQVDPAKLTSSTIESLEMMRQLNLLLQRIRDSKPFASQLMDAAQRGNRAEVDRLIKSAGVSRQYTINYNPQGFHLVMRQGDTEAPCCKVEITLYWGE
ncbi:hypothetical protein [Paenibacillus marinisediminis]